VSLVEVSMHLIASISDRRWHVDLIRLCLDVMKDAARDGKVAAEFSDCVRQVILQTWLFWNVPGLW
jgi:hypothetical protein